MALPFVSAGYGYIDSNSLLMIHRQVSGHVHGSTPPALLFRTNQIAQNEGCHIALPGLFLPEFVGYEQPSCRPPQRGYNNLPAHPAGSTVDGNHFNVK
jgi:hypothetical protein